MTENCRSLPDRWAFERRQDAVQALLGVLNDIGGGQVDNYNVITEAAEDALDATGLVADAVRLRAALKPIAITTCREWIDDKADCCNAPAEFILWGRLIDPEGLGPRCYDHAAEHVGHRALGDPSWAIVDLRPAREALNGGTGGR